MVSPSAGIILTVSVLVAASLAAYENPHVRAWIDRTRQKIAMSLHSLGDEIDPPRPTRQKSNDASMHAEKGEEAEERRRQAIAEIMERGRVMEERRKTRKSSDNEKSRSPSFDNLVDDNGALRSPTGTESSTAAQASGVDRSNENIKQRGIHSVAQDVHQTVDEVIPSRDLTSSQDDNVWESRYEQEMREAWNIPLSDRRIELPSSHASESLIDLTPTTENAPDPEISIPSAEYLHRLEPSDYFSAAASNSTHTLSDGSSVHLLPPTTAVHPSSHRPNSASLAPSVDGSISSIHASELDDNSDDMLSEMGDGIRTPASVWTDVGSTVSGEHHL
ncbi:hypothetical protein EDD37DRAFT_343250 [Exophiala viscosa]|uniref:Uncharacterized protein n=1 Tax=Exophiala viscosa TaxID=2486360 RepID=A0AAN6DVC9_9EURO|nr:hypothetical protein EDD36DRAFT_419441 [Exophiala viscosa]KAI1626375.1 hypothetical protein EDD37DRAFT_343250 [Exophiala viscosa]